MARTGSTPVRPSKTTLTRSFGDNRTCTASGCDTTLSRYNPDAFCFVHRDQVPHQGIIGRSQPPSV
jgi:hypothetical protein